MSEQLKKYYKDIVESARQSPFKKSFLGFANAKAHENKEAELCAVHRKANDTKVYVSLEKVKELTPFLGLRYAQKQLYKKNKKSKKTNFNEVEDVDSDDDATVDEMETTKKTTVTVPVKKNLKSEISKHKRAPYMRMKDLESLKEFLSPEKYNAKQDEILAEI